MDPEPLVGIRPEDLSEEEIDAQAELLASDADLAAEHRDSLQLTASLRGLPVHRPAFAPPRRHTSSRRYAVGAGLLAAAAALFIILPGEQGDRDRAVSGGSLGALQLSAAAEGPSGLRPLAQGTTVHEDEWVVFQVQAESAGTLTLTEISPSGTATVYPQSGSWAVQAGAHYPGGASPVSWRPDDGGGPRRYVARLCGRAPESGCIEDTLELRWSE